MLRSERFPFRQKTHLRQLVTTGMSSESGPTNAHSVDNLVDSVLIL